MVKINPIYTAEVHATGGRSGHVASSDGVLDMDVSMPKELGGKDGYTNPEQLFAAGYAACFGGAIGAVAQGKNVKDFKIRAKATIGKTEEGAFGISASLEVYFPNLSQEEGQGVVEAAHQVCPYSVATRGNIEVTVSAVAEAF